LQCLWSVVVEQPPFDHAAFLVSMIAPMKQKNLSVIWKLHEHAHNAKITRGKLNMCDYHSYYYYFLLLLATLTLHTAAVPAVRPQYKRQSKHIQLFRQKLSHKSVKAYATMPISIMGRKSLALIDLGSRCLPTKIEKA